jgi:hypothetical protein
MQEQGVKIPDSPLLVLIATSYKSVMGIVRGVPIVKARLCIENKFVTFFCDGHW